MLKILIVDDEKYTRQGLSKNIRWSQLGIGTVFLAEDAIKALDVICKHSPEIIISDIRMPEMDGIELARLLKDKNENCKIILMTAYADKDYLKSAINLKINSFVEKPLDIKEIEAAVKRAVDEYLSETDQKAREQQLISTYSYSIPIIIRDLVFGLCKQQETDGYLKHIQQLIPSFFNSSMFLSSIVLIQHKEEHQNSIRTELFENKVKEIISKSAESSGLKVIQEFKDCEVIIVHIAFEDSLKVSVNDILQDFSKDVLIRMSDFARAFIAFGEITKDIRKLYISYQTAVLASQKVFFRGYGGKAFSTDKGKGALQIESSMADKFSELLKKHQISECTSYLRVIVDALKTKEDTLVDNVKELFFNFFQLVMKVANENNVELFVDINKSVGILEIIKKTKTLADLEELLLSKIILLFKEIEENNRFSKVTADIIKHIRLNYSNQGLTVNSISEKFFMNKAYLCVLFKKETGKTINQFITLYRIEMSKELLKDGRSRLADVCTKVGFADPNYFTKVFKNVMGISPSEYKDRYKLMES